MTAPVEDAESTCGYLLCHHRRFGCCWSIVFRAWVDEPKARLVRDAHQVVCSFRPYPDLYT